MEVRIEVESRSEKDLYTLDLECLSLHAIKGYHNIHAIILVVQGLSRELTDEKARGEQRLAQVRAVNGQFPVLSSSPSGVLYILIPRLGSAAWSWFGFNLPCLPCFSASSPPPWLSVRPFYDSNRYYAF